MQSEPVCVSESSACRKALSPLRTRGPEAAVRQLRDPTLFGPRTTAKTDIALHLDCKSRRRTAYAWRHHYSGHAGTAIKGGTMVGIEILLHPIHLGLGAKAEVEPAFAGEMAQFNASVIA